LESICHYSKYTSEGVHVGAGNDVVVMCFWVKVNDKAAEGGEQADKADGFQQSGNVGDSPRATVLSLRRKLLALVVATDEHFDGVYE